MRVMSDGTVPMGPGSCVVVSSVVGVSSPIGVKAVDYGAPPRIADEMRRIAERAGVDWAALGRQPGVVELSADDVSSVQRIAGRLGLPPPIPGGVTVVGEVTALTRQRDEAVVELTKVRAQRDALTSVLDQLSRKTEDQRLVLREQRDDARAELDHLRSEVDALLVDLAAIRDADTLRRWHEAFWGSAREIGLRAQRDVPAVLTMREPTDAELRQFAKLRQHAENYGAAQPVAVATRATSAPPGVDDLPVALPSQAPTEPPRAARDDPAVGRAVARALGAQAGLRCPW